MWRFDAEVVEWRGPAPFLFAPLPPELSDDVREASRGLQYWGQVPVLARVGATEFATAMWPRGGCYLLPIRMQVQRAEGVGLGDDVAVELRLRPPT